MTRIFRFSVLRLPRVINTNQAAATAERESFHRKVGRTRSDKNHAAAPSGGNPAAKHIMHNSVSFSRR